ncbi:MAG TPA: hypothetical protein IAD07_04915 [Candidatus Fimivicinus intestinavium]|nr:hypothetical protein [Candidatus Fimivicinus intestinavium]
MKKRVISTLSCIILMMCLLSNFSSYAIVNTDSTVIYYPDGSYMIDTIEAIPLVSTKASTSTLSGSKTRTFYDSADKVKWKFTVTGTFEYTYGNSVKCTKATPNTQIYDDNWRAISQSAWASGNSAIGEATLKRYLLGIPVRTEEVRVTLTCDKYGTLS